VTRRGLCPLSEPHPKSVLDGGRLCGIVSIGDIVKYRLDDLELEVNILRENLMAGH
jgi:hypothetical protein